MNDTDANRQDYLGSESHINRDDGIGTTLRNAAICVLIAAVVIGATAVYLTLR